MGDQCGRVVATSRGQKIPALPRTALFDRFAVVGDQAAAEDEDGFLSFALRADRSDLVDGLFMKRRPLDQEQTTETAWTTITLAIRQVRS
jgi:hypothetical protein